MRRLKTFDRKKDADAYHASVKVDVKAGIHTTSKTTVIQAGEKWIADAEGRLERRDRQDLSGALKAPAPLIGGISCGTSPFPRSAISWTCSGRLGARPT